MSARIKSNNGRVIFIVDQRQFCHVSSVWRCTDSVLLAADFMALLFTVLFEEHGVTPSLFYHGSPPRRNM